MISTRRAMVAVLLGVAGGFILGFMVTDTFARLEGTYEKARLYRLYEANAPCSVDFYSKDGSPRFSRYVPPTVVLPPEAGKDVPLDK